MQLKIKRKLNREICHYAESNMLITSQANKIFIENDGMEKIIYLPMSFWNKIFSMSRFLRRCLRLDKCSVVPVADGVVIVKYGNVFHYNSSSCELKNVLALQQCRNILSQSIVAINGKELYFGEYGLNPKRLDVPIYKSIDGGRSWSKVFSFQKNKTKHIHACCYDHFTNKIWVLTGDYKNECWMLCADKDFKNIG
jgi:hypothetical protein